VASGPASPHHFEGSSAREIGRMTFPRNDGQGVLQSPSKEAKGRRTPSARRTPTVMCGLGASGAAAVVSAAAATAASA
jgi:hypothetical protein